MKTHIFKVLFIFGLVFMAGGAEANGCTFTRSLGEGARGEDVRCLQQYLMSSGNSYSYGYTATDGNFGPMTRQAVSLWQSRNGVYPAYGYFDPQSIAKYYELVPYSTSYNYYTTGGSVLGASTSIYTNPITYSSTETRARQKIEEAVEAIEEAEDEIEDSSRNTSSAENYLEEAKDNLFQAVREFFVARDFADAEDFADDAIENAEDAQNEVDGGGNRSDADNAIDDARDAIEEAEDEIDDADDRGVYVRYAQDLLDEAQDLLDDAEEEFDDENYDEAEDLANDAEILAEEAIDEVN